MKEKLADLWAIVRRPFLVVLIILGLVALIVLPGIHEYRSFVSPFEDPKALAITDKTVLLENASYLPQRAAQAVVFKLGFETPAYLRMVSVGMAICCIFAMYYVLKHWYTARVAMFGTILFATSSWFLHQARSAEFGMSYIIATLALVCIGVWASERKRPWLLPFVALTIGLTLYVPGFWLLVIFASIFGRREIAFMWGKSSIKSRLLAIFLFLTSLAPLAYSVFTNPSQYRQILGFAGGEQALSGAVILKNFGDVWLGFAVRGVDEPLRWLVGTPILDAASLILLGLGIYSYHSKLHPIRYKTILWGLIIALILMVLGGFEYIGIAIVFAYLFISAGLGLLLQQWFSVFPKNPVARTVGVTCIAVLVAGIAYFHVTRYYIGWTHADSTRRAIIQK